MPPIVYYDHAEERSGIPRQVAGYGCDVRPQRLGAGDYLVSAALAIERKSPTDFVDSLLNGKLYRQLTDLGQYQHGVLLIEGDDWRGNPRLKLPVLGELYHWLSFRPNLTCIYAPTARHTAKLVADLARREQRGAPGPPSGLPQQPTARTPAQILQAFPGVGAANADKLLRQFGSVRAVISASEEELVAVIGRTRGARLNALLSESRAA